MIDKLLVKLNACEEAREWAIRKDLHTVWTTCERGDWLLWLASRMVGEPGWHTRQEVVLAACACAETVLKYVPAEEDRPQVAIETARKWARGEATNEEIIAALKAVNAALEATYAATYAAVYAVYAVYAAANAANVAVNAATQKDLADIVRIHLKEPKYSPFRSHSGRDGIC